MAEQTALACLLECLAIVQINELYWQTLFVEFAAAPGASKVADWQVAQRIYWLLNL